jgi:hypothetical protein
MNNTPESFRAPAMNAQPVAWLCEFAREDGSTATEVLLEDPECTRWADSADGDGVSPYRVTPLYTHPAQAAALPAVTPRPLIEAVQAVLAWWNEWAGRQPQNNEIENAEWYEFHNLRAELGRAIEAEVNRGRTIPAGVDADDELVAEKARMMAAINKRDERIEAVRLWFAKWEPVVPLEAHKEFTEAMPWAVPYGVADSQKDSHG